MRTQLFKVTHVIDGLALFLDPQLDLSRFRHVKPLDLSPLTISAGVMEALKQGIAPLSLRRPLSGTSQLKRHKASGLGEI